MITLNRHTRRSPYSGPTQVRYSVRIDGFEVRLVDRTMYLSEVDRALALKVVKALEAGRSTVTQFKTVYTLQSDAIATVLHYQHTWSVGSSQIPA